jgi:hypothetical protein
MNPISCPHETDVSKSVRTGRWDCDVKEHVKECSYCRNVAQVAEWLGNIGGTGEERCALPDPGQIWLNARIMAMQSVREKALRPLAIAEFVLRVTAALALVVGVIWIWFLFQKLVEGWTLPNHLHVPPPILVSAAALATCLVALLFIKLFQPILAEE